MRIEFEVAGIDVQFVSINKLDAVAQQGKLTAKCSFPLIQDLDTIDAYALLGGGKDDFFIYNADGTLAKYLPIAGAVDVNLGTDEGYQSLKDQIMEVVE